MKLFTQIDCRITKTAADGLDLPDRFKIYRSVWLAEGEQPRLDNPGEYWADSPDGAGRSGFPPPPGKRRQVILETDVSRDDVDFQQTMSRRKRYGEPEIVLKTAPKKARVTASTIGSSLPPPPGTAPVKDGWVRLYHQTDREKIESIKREGLSYDYAAGIEGPKAIWASRTPFYGDAKDIPTVEFQVEESAFVPPSFVTRNVPPEDIIAIHEPWHQHARYMLKTIGPERVLSGEYDYLAPGSDEADAVAWIKRKYATANTRLTRTSGTEGPFAVFVVAPVDGGGYAATTRAADRGETGRIGLPGGKVDPGEAPVDALVRECAEEGWTIAGVESEPAHMAEVDGKPVWWYRARSANMLKDFKEKGRITPVAKPLSQIAESGYGNEWLRDPDMKTLVDRFLKSDEVLRKNRLAALSKFDDVQRELESVPDGWGKTYAAGKLADWRKRFESGENPHVGNSPYDHMPIYLDRFKNIREKEMEILQSALEIVVDGVRKIVRDPAVRYTEDPKPIIEKEKSQNATPDGAYGG
jgi:hypothetical protein